MMMKEEMGTALTEEAGIDLQRGGEMIVGDLQVPMVEAGRGLALIMVVVPAHITNLNKGVVLIMVELKALFMRGIAG